MKSADMCKINPYTEMIWEFYRDDMSFADFEQCVYRTPELENVLGNQVYYQVITSDYRNSDKVWELKQLLKSAIDQIAPSQCYCPMWKDNQKEPISLETGWEIITEDFDILRKQTPWLELSECKHCGQFWYVAIDAIEDDFYLHRLTAEEAEKTNTKNVWPPFFDEKAVFWPSSAWLNMNEYTSLEDWQESNNG